MLRTYDVAIVGGVVVFGEMTAASSKDVMTISGVKGIATTNVDFSGMNLENEIGENDKYLKVKALFVDGTSAEIKITKIDGVKISDSNKSDIAPKTLYTYSKLSDGTYDVKKLSSTNKAGYDLISSGAYKTQKIDGKTLSDDAVVFVMGTETKILTGKQIKDWADGTNDFEGMYAATESNGINYIKVAALAAAAAVPNADGDIKYGYMVANSYASSMEGEDGTKTAYEVWTNDGAKTLYVDGSGADVKSGSVLAYKEDGKFITVYGSFKPTAGHNQYATTGDITFKTYAITGFDYTAEGTIAARNVNKSVELTLDKDCVFIAVNSKDEEGMEGGMEGVQFATPAATANKYIPNAVMVTIKDGTEDKVVAVVYDANNVDWESVKALEF